MPSIPPIYHRGSSHRRVRRVPTLFLGDEAFIVDMDKSHAIDVIGTVMKPLARESPRRSGRPG